LCNIVPMPDVQLFLRPWLALHKKQVLLRI
jgi:hypothetical protein